MRLVETGSPGSPPMVTVTDALVTGLLLAFSEKHFGSIDAAINKAKNDPVSVVVETVVEALVEIGDRDPDLYLVLMNQIPRVGELGDVVAFLQSRMAEPIEALLIARADELTAGYLRARNGHFRVLKTYFNYGIALRLFLTGGLLIAGTLFVVSRQMTLASSWPPRC